MGLSLSLSLKREERKHKTKRGLGFNFPVEWGDLDLEQKKGKELVSQ